MKIKALPKIDLPREKLQKYGTNKLSDFELFAILLGSGTKGVNVLQLSKKILKVISKIGKENITLEHLLEIKGLGAVKASQILAVIELTKRFSHDNPEILSTDDIAKLCSDFRSSKREHFVAFYLDTQSRLIERSIISIGTLDASLVHPREVFEPAVALHAASIIVVHNHPSGLLKPSMADNTLTQQLQEAGKILGIPIENHIILSPRGWLSYAQEGLI